MRRGSKHGDDNLAHHAGSNRKKDNLFKNLVVMSTQWKDKGSAIPEHRGRTGKVVPNKHGSRTIYIYIYI